MCVLFGFIIIVGWYIYYIVVMRYGLRYKFILVDKIELLFKFIFFLLNIIIVFFIVLIGNGFDLFWIIVNIILVVLVFINFLGLFIFRDKYFKFFKDYKVCYMGIGEVDFNFFVFYEDNFEIKKVEDVVREKIKVIRDLVY